MKVWLFKISNLNDNLGQILPGFFMCKTNAKKNI